MVLAENDPTRGIVDIETFGNWIINYRNNLVEDPTVKRFVVTVPTQSGIQGTNSVEIVGYPWEKVPLSLQEVISLKYKMSIDNSLEKTLHIQIEPDKLIFELTSPTIVNDIDTLGEKYVPIGVTLHFTDNIPLLKGRFMISKAPAIAKVEMADIVRKVLRKKKVGKDFVRLLERFEVINFALTSVPYLCDIARLLSSARDYVEVAEFAEKPQQNL